MSFPFVSRASYDAVRAENVRLRARAEAAEQEAATERNARRTITRQHAELDAANRRLADRNIELGRRISRLGESDPEYAARLEKRVARLRTVGARLLAAYTAEKRRADRLASHLDDGDLKAIKTWEARVTAHDSWTPGHPDKKPMEGGTGRPTHPAIELRQAQEQCRLLQAQIDAYGKRVAS